MSGSRTADSEVTNAWEILHRAGLPLAGARSGPPPSSEQIGRAVLTVRDSGSGTAREHEAFGAFVLAWASHWPHTFARVLGAEASATLRAAEAASIDPERRIKLRRIALENLSRVL